MTAVWPITLPTQVLVNGHIEKWLDLLVASDMEVGPPKYRRRYSGVMKQITGTMFMDRAQTETFETFFYGASPTGINAGVSPFQFNLPRSTGLGGTPLLKTARFLPGGMNLKPLSTSKWQVDFNIRIDP